MGFTNSLLMLLKEKIQIILPFVLIKEVVMIGQKFSKNTKQIGMKHPKQLK